EAAVREVLEETGLVVRDPTFVGVHPFEMRNQLLFTYHVRAPATRITLCETELDAYRIVPIAELVPWNRGTGPALRDWLASRGHQRERSDFGRHVAEDVSGAPARSARRDCRTGRPRVFASRPGRSARDAGHRVARPQTPAQAKIERRRPQ